MLTHSCSRLGCERSNSGRLLPHRQHNRLWDGRSGAWVTNAYGCVLTAKGLLLCGCSFAGRQHCRASTWDVTSCTTDGLLLHPG